MTYSANNRTGNIAGRIYLNAQHEANDDLVEATMRFLSELKVVDLPDYLLSAIDSEAQQYKRTYDAVLQYARSDSDLNPQECLECINLFLPEGEEKHKAIHVTQALNKLLDEGMLKPHSFCYYCDDNETIESGFFADPDRYDPDPDTESND